MSQHDRFELPKGIERYLAALSKLYAQEGKRELQEIIVNAQVRVQEEWSYDNWNGGTYGHALFLIIPEALFLGSVATKDELQKQISQDLNKIHNVQNEFIQEVFIEMEVLEDSEWRRDSGLLVAGKRVVLPDATKRLWEEDRFRLFLSHKVEVKKETSELKASVGLLGVSCFVAHEDIHPTKEWQDEIENALVTMDGFVALLTDNFHESDWTDQEVGYALARGVPLIAVRLGRNPYGFIGKFQALSSTWETAPMNIFRILIKQDRMFSAYVHALRACISWENGNKQAEVLPFIDSLSPEQIDELVGAYNETSELHGSWGFRGTRPGPYGPGLVYHLNRLGTRKFRFKTPERIEVVS
jgi:hypothetical protein